MCKVSDKLKLCTCKTQHVEQLKHYWILYRYQKSEIILMGEPMLPQEYEIGKEDDVYNYKKLEEMLNEENCFDVGLPVSNKDILELNFSCIINSNTKEERRLVYEFIYKEDRWTANEFDPFDTNRIEKHKGEITNPFIKTQR